MQIVLGRRRFSSTLNWGKVPVSKEITIDQTCQERNVTGALTEGQRWSAARKREVVLRLLRGESVDALSREVIEFCF